jgi:hypothetical protein
LKNFSKNVQKLAKPRKTKEIDQISGFYPVIQKALAFCYNITVKKIQNSNTPFLNRLS